MRWDGGTLIWSPTWDRSAMTTHGPCCVSIKAEAFRSAVRDCGGTIEISGSAGNFTGGALPHRALGMRDGIICVGRNTGERTGDRMRRGLLVINGDSGRYCGSNMIAGTIIVTGHTAASVGLGMRRGSIVLLQEPAEMPATFNDCGIYSLTILALLLRYVGSVNRRAYSRLRSMQRVRRFAGDIGCNGQGELLVLSP